MLQVIFALGDHVTYVQNVGKRNSRYGTTAFTAHINLLEGHL